MLELLRYSIKFRSNRVRKLDFGLIGNLFIKNCIYIYDVILNCDFSKVFY